MADVILGAIRKARGYDVVQTPEAPAPKPEIKKQNSKKPKHSERGPNGKFVKKK